MYSWRVYPYHAQQTPASAGTTYGQTMTVIGQGTITVKPDTVIITLGIRTENANVSQALTENSHRAQAMIEALKAIDVKDEDIDTSSFSIYPKYEYADGKSSLVGYEVEHIFDITVNDVKKAGRIYETAVANGANVARNIRFKLSNPNIYYQQALANALRNAKEKAVTLARTLGMPFNEIPVEIKEESVQPIEPGAVPKTMVVLAEQATPPIQTQDIVIIASLQAVFAY